MSFVWVKQDTPNPPHRVNQVTITPQILEQIADILQIPQADRGRFISGTIYIGPTSSPSSPGGGTSPSSPAGGPGEGGR